MVLGHAPRTAFNLHEESRKGSGNPPRSTSCASPAHIGSCCMLAPIQERAFRTAFIHTNSKHGVDSVEPKSARAMGTACEILRVFWRTFVTVLTPIVFLPIIFVYPSEVGV